MKPGDFTKMPGGRTGTGPRRGVELGTVDSLSPEGGRQALRTDRSKTN